MVVFQGLRPDRIERIGCLDWRGWAFREVAIDGAGMGKKNCSIVRIVLIV